MRTNTTEVKQQEFIKVTAISDMSARGITPYNAEISVEWTMNLPSPIPQVGEWWVIERSNMAGWTFVSKITSGSYNAQYYSVILDMVSCIGRERSVADDIRNMGVHNVYLRVISDGQAFWNSTAAKKLGYVVNGERTRQIVSRLRDYDINVVFLLDCDSIPELTSNQKYRQASINRSGSVAFGGRMSYPAVKDIVAEMVLELYEQYSVESIGVCFENFGLLPPEMPAINSSTIYDVSHAAESAYTTKYGSVPPYSILLDRSNSAWYENWVKWLDFWHQQYDDFLSTIRNSGIGNYPVSVIVPSETITRAPTDGCTGSIYATIGDNIGRLNWSSFGVPLEYTYQQDEELEMCSMELSVAMAKRLADSSAPFYVIDIAQTFQPEGVFSTLAKYEASNVILDDYEKWRAKSSDDTIPFLSAMNKYSVVEKSALNEVGFYISSASRDSSYNLAAMNHRWFDAIEDIAASILSSLPYKLHILFDEDMEDEGRLESLSLIIAVTPSRLSKESIDVIGKIIDREDLNIVIAGSPMDENGNVLFLDKFNQGAEFDALWFGPITIDKKGFSNSKEVFYIEDGTGVMGILPALSSGDARGYHGYLPSVLTGGIAPVFFHKRSSIVAMDVTSSGVLIDMVGRLAMYAVGRDGIEE